jgi:hypothetical protein
VHQICCLWVVAKAMRVIVRRRLFQYASILHALKTMPPPRRAYNVIQKSGDNLGTAAPAPSMPQRRDSSLLLPLLSGS